MLVILICLQLSFKLKQVSLFEVRTVEISNSKKGKFEMKYEVMTGTYPIVNVEL